jgi:hypothetical protein
MSVLKKVNLKDIVQPKTRGGQEGYHWIRFCIVHNRRCFLVTLLKGYSHALKVHKRENFLGFDFEICTFS